ncbi:hypothetical protein BDN70DRAFT_939934, partial [Pholiota conissans]
QLEKLQDQYDVLQVEHDELQLLDNQCAQDLKQAKVERDRLLHLYGTNSAFADCTACGSVMIGDRYPVTLSCGHTACAICLRSNARVSSSQNPDEPDVVHYDCLCPDCNSQQYTGLHPSSFLKDLFAIVAEIPELLA